MVFVGCVTCGKKNERKKRKKKERNGREIENNIEGALKLKQ